MTVDDDETASATVTLSVDPASVAEEVGEREITVTGTLDQAPRAQATAVTVSVAGDTATAPADFAAVADFELTIAAGELSGAETFTLTPVNDDVDETDETVTVSGAVADADGRADGDRSAGDDHRQRRPRSDGEPTKLEVTEGASETYTVALTSEPTDDVTVAVTVPAGAEFTVEAEELTFAVGAWETAQTVTVRAGRDDDAVAAAAASIEHEVSGGDYAGEAADAVAVTVLEADTARADLTLEFGPPTHTDTDSSGAVTLGDGLSYEASARNSGNVPLSNVTVSDERAGGAAKVCATLGIGESCEWSGSYQVTQADVDAGKVENTVTATADEVTDQQANQSTTVAQKRELTLVKTAQAASFGAVGESIDYTYEVSNSGTVTLAGTVTIEDDKIASGITCDAVPEEGLGPGDTVTCTGSYTTVQADVDGSEVVNKATATLAGVQSSEDSERVTWISTQAGQPTVELGVGAVAGEEAVGSLRFSVRLSAASEQTVTVEYETADATATAGSDYTAAAVDSVLTFTAGTTVGTIEVTIADDKVDEEDETFTVRLLRDPVNATLGAAATATATIVDDDDRGVTVSPTKLEVTEGGRETYTVVLRSEPTGDVTVEMAVSGDEDVTVSPESLTFTNSNWATRQTVTVSADEDVDGDDDTAEITHTVGGGDYASESAKPVDVTVIDDETASTTVTLSVHPASVAEEVSGREITVTGTLDQAPRAQATAVTVSVAGDTATAPADFAVVADFELTIAAGELSGAETFTLTPVNDDVDETDETVTVSGAVADAAAGLTVAEAQVTITDNDDRGVTVSPTELEVTEGASETYTVALTSQPTEDVTVAVTVPAGAEFTVEEAELTFAVGAWETAQTVTVRAARDDDAVAATPERIEHDVTGGDYAGEAADAVAVTVLEADTARADLTLEFGPPTHTDTDSSGAVTLGDGLSYEASARNSGNVPLSNVTVSDERAGGAAKMCATLGIGESCEWSGSYGVTQADVDAGKVENTVTATADEVTDQQANQSTTVAQKRELTLVKTAQEESFGAVGESIGYTYEVSNSGTVTLAGTVTIEDDKIASGITCDAVPVGGLGPGDTVTCTGSYTTVQADVDGSEVVNKATATLAGVQSSEDSERVTWISTQAGQPTVELGVGAVAGEEAVGSLRFSVRLSAASEQTVTVEYETADATATAGSDYTAAAVDSVLTFTAGTTVGTIEVTIADDKVDEEDETFTVRLLRDPVNATLGAAATATATIVDDDDRGVTVSPTKLEVTEGGRETYTVVLRSEPTGDVTVETAASGDEDVTVSPESLTFTNSNWATRQTVTVSADEDVDGDDDTAEITHTVGGGDYASESAKPVDVTVIDDETASTTVTLSVHPASVAEEVSGREITVTGTLDQAPRAQATAVTVSVAGDTATAPADFAVVADFELTIAAGELSGAETFTLTPVNDDVDETDETVTVSGAVADAAAGLTVAEAQVTITDNDDRGVTVSPTELEVTEGASETYTVALTSQPTEDVTVTVTVPAGTDVSVDEDPLRFTSTTWKEAQTVTVRVAADDDALADETVTLTHEVRGGDYGANGVAAEPVEVVIIETDTPTLSVSDARAGEASGQMVFAVTLSQASSEEVVVEYATADGTAEAGSDYSATTGKLTFAAGTTATQEIRVSIADDTVDEAEEETFTVTLSGALNATLAGGGTTLSATGTIADDDDPAVTVAFDRSSYTATEGGSAATVTVRLSGDPERTVEIPLTHTPGTGAGAGDYSGMSASVTFGSGDTERMLTLTATDDAVDEEEETVTLGFGTLPERVTPGTQNTAILTLTDNDDRGVTVSPTTLEVTEGGSETYTVVLTSEPTDDVTVAVNVPEGAEFTAAEEKLTFTSTNWEETQTVTVRAARDDDAVAATPERIEHDVTGGDYAGEAADAVAVTVLEADTANADLTLQFGVPTHTDTDGSGAVTLGDELSYEASARNSGNVPLSNVTVSDERAGGAAKVCATLGIGESCEWSGSYQVTQADVDAGKVDNTVTATADEVADQQANQSTTVAQKRELTLVKTAQAASFGAVGESIDYTYEVSNSGTVTLAGTVTIEDDKIASGITCDAVPEEGLGPGDTVTCTGSYTTVQADVDGSEVVNKATATLAGVKSSEETERVSWRAPQGGQPTVELDVGAVSVVETAGSLEVQRDVERGEPADGDGGVRDGGRDGDGGQRLHGGGGGRQRADVHSGNDGGDDRGGDRRRQVGRRGRDVHGEAAGRR